MSFCTGAFNLAAAGVLGTSANLRALPRRHTGLNPSAYRRRFGP